MVLGPNILVQRIRDVTIVTLQTASLLEVTQIQKLAEALYTLVDEQDRKRLVLDFEKVRGISSSMLGVLLTLKRKVDDADGRLVLCSLAKDLRRLFELAALDRVFEFAPNSEQALAVFGVTTAG